MLNDDNKTNHVHAMIDMISSCITKKPSLTVDSLSHDPTIVKLSLQNRSVILDGYSFIYQFAPDKYTHKDRALNEYGGITIDIKNHSLDPTVLAHSMASYLESGRIEDGVDGKYLRLCHSGSDYYKLLPEWEIQNQLASGGVLQVEHSDVMINFKDCRNPVSVKEFINGTINTTVMGISIYDLRWGTDVIDVCYDTISS